MLCEIDWIAVSSAMLTPTIAILGLRIAHQQSQLSKLRYKYELYDRRLDVYKSLRKLVNNAETANYETAMIIFDSLTESHFLFNDDISSYLKDIWDKTNELASTNSKIKEGYIGIDDKKLELIHWFSNQYEVSTFKFQTYLQLNK